MNNPLLQEPLPVLQRELPKIWIRRLDTTGIDGNMLCIQGVGEVLIPHLVDDAICELQSHGMWEAMGYHCIGKPVSNQVTPNQNAALLALCLRYNEMNYTSFELVNELPART